MSGDRRLDVLDCWVRGFAIFAPIAVTVASGDIDLMMYGWAPFGLFSLMDGKR